METGKQEEALLKEPNFNYNTINGLDKKTVERMKVQYGKHGYRNKTEFLVFLWKTALDVLENQDLVSDPKSAKDIVVSLNELKESLGRIEANQGREEADKGLYDTLLIELYWILNVIAEQWNVDTSYIRNGNMDELPYRLTIKQREVMNNYGDTKRAG